jgi:hypothetical protein
MWNKCCSNQKATKCYIYSYRNVLHIYNLIYIHVYANNPQTYVLIILSLDKIFLILLFQ